MRKLVAILMFSLLTLAGCGTPSTGASGHIVLANAGWDSIILHNHIVGFIAEHAFGLTWEELPGSTPITYEALKAGDIDVYTEIWTENIPSYAADLAAGTLIEMSVNFDDNAQGLYVPAYVIYGDATRGIAPMAPNLRSVADLAAYADVFKDEEDPNKGRLYGAIPGWAVDEIVRNKWQYYGLDATFNYFSPGSDAALSAALTASYDRGEAIVGYYWEPTWLMGQYDFVLLEDAPYVDEASFRAGMTEFGAAPVTVGVRPGFIEDYPEFSEFLKNYTTSSAMTSAALAYMESTGASYVETAKWFIQTYQDEIAAMLTAAQMQTVLDALGD